MKGVGAVTFAEEEMPSTLPVGTRRQHHYIPVFYLKQWATGSDRRLCEFSRPYITHAGAVEPEIKSVPVKPRRTAPEGTGYIKDLNLFPALRPELVNYLENEFFRRVDNDAAAVMRRLIRRDIDLDHQSKSAWSRFLMSMFHRSPEGIQRVIGYTATRFPTEVEEFRSQYNALRTSDEQETFDDFISSFAEPDYQYLNLGALRTIMNSRRIGRILNNMIWTVLPNIGRYPLFTSDRPITMTSLGAPNAHLTMPLSPNHIFLAAANAFTMEQLENKILCGGFAELMNNRVARQARKYVYAVDDARQDFLTGRLGDRQQWSPME